MSPIAKLVVLLSVLLACEPRNAEAAPKREIVNVTIADLIGRPLDFKGKRIRVSGYLVILSGGSQLLEPRWEQCYGSEEGRRYLITDLTYAAAAGGAQKEPMPLIAYVNNGRMVTVTGIFRHQIDPWPLSPTIEAQDIPAAGPLRHARVESYGNARCDNRLSPAG